MMKRGEMLDEAKKIVTTDRNEQYGEPENNFEVVAELWMAYMQTSCVPKGVDLCILAEDVAIMMSLFKIGRISSSYRPSEDCFVDLAGYAACACELATKED